MLDKLSVTAEMSTTEHSDVGLEVGRWGGVGVEEKTGTGSLGVYVHRAAIVCEWVSGERGL